MEYANGYIFPRDAQGNEGDNTIPESPQIENLEERQNLEIAMEVILPFSWKIWKYPFDYINHIA